jgi:predicted ATPase
MPFTLTVHNYRALRNVEWSPQGVCALVGPNGAGKSTLLDVLLLLRHTFEFGLVQALNQHGGLDNLQSFESNPGERVGFSLSGNLPDSYRWQITFNVGALNARGLYAEYAFDVAGPSILRLEASKDVKIGEEQIPGDERSALRTASDMFKLGQNLSTIRSLVQTYRCYATYHFTHLRESGSPITADKVLDPHGRNVFSLLRNWRDTRADRVRYDFVMQNLRAIFPDTFADLDFETAGTTVTGRVVTPRPDATYPITFAPNGLLTALLHLCAVASVAQGGVVAIDELENSLHPFAIKHLIESFRKWSTQTQSTVLLSTHSPVVLDQFRECPEQVFVMERGQATNPVPLPKVRDPEYLAHFSLGDLYAHLDFGSPVDPKHS